MNDFTGQPKCPHCEQPLQPFTLPAEAGYEAEYHFACFNDECPYYVRGWDWMMDKYGVKSSYRFRVDPNAGTTSPIAVWSADALKDRIVRADVSVSTPSTDDEEEPGE